MSWLFSRALVAEYSAANSSAGEQFAPSNGTATQQAFLWRDKTTATWKRSPFGITWQPLTASLGEALLTWFREVSRAKTLAAPAVARGLMESEAECGNTWRASLAKYDRDSRLWKTPQCSLLAGLDEFSETWPSWGMMRGGVVWAQTPLVFDIEEPDFGWLPTPTATDGKGGARRSNPAFQNCSLRHYLHGQLGGEWASSVAHPSFVEAEMGWPTMWTDLRPLETANVQAWRRWHGEFWAGRAMSEEAA